MKPRNPFVQHIKMKKSGAHITTKKQERQRQKKEMKKLLERR